MPTVITKGAKTAQGYGFAAKAAAAVTYPYIEDVFSTYLYTGNGSTQTITNNIDLSTKGGLVWMKGRSGATAHALYDTARGATFDLASNTGAAQTTQSTGLTAFGTTGFSIGSLAKINTSADTYVSWTFRKQAKFFDVVTYTGNGAASQTISHNLGSTPGFIVVKTSSGSSSQWFCWHTNYTGPGLYLNSATVYPSDAQIIGATPTSTSFVVNDGGYNMNASGYTYVAYLFASNAGGFGNAGTDNVITCGSFTTDASGLFPLQTLGYEPQWLMFKDVTIGGSWQMIDTMRGWSNTGDRRLTANSAAAEVADSASPNYIVPSATGFSGPTAGLVNDSSTYIYIAIRRGPMATPTTGTSVFSPLARTGTGAITTVTTSISPVDMMWVADRSGTLGTGPNDFDRLRGANQLLVTSTTAAEVTTTDTLTSFAVQNGYTLGADAGGYAVNGSGYSFINWNFKRAPGFFDVVCYTGTGSATTQTHNLGVVPELMIVKRRSNNDGAGYWAVYSAATGATKFLTLNATGAENTNSTFWNNTAPTSSVFTVGTITRVNGSGETYVAYLFATCPGVSKVGSYTGNGTTQTIDCGFTGGARFVLIKRTDSTGDWYVYDTARGMTTLTDPYLLLNSTAAETATLGSVTTVSTGFALNSSILAAINVSGGSYIFLAIA